MHHCLIMIVFRAQALTLLAGARCRPSPSLAPHPRADPGVEIGGGHMASAEREPIIGVWGLCPQRGPGAEPLVRGAKPPEAERFLVLSYV